MDDVIRLIGPERAVELFGVRLVGVNAENGKKLLFTLVFVLIVVLVSRLLSASAHAGMRDGARMRAVFWTRQGIKLATMVVLVVGVLSIWFNDPTRLATALGLVSAGLAFALQKVVTAVAGYFVILRGNTFSVGDRIVMGGVRGDVIGLDIAQTTIMEMGQPPGTQGADPAMWVQSRQYTGRVVTITNAKVFDEPVYNYTREFPYLWEELSIPVSYSCDRARVEQILLDAATRHTVPIGSLGEEALQEMQRRYVLKRTELKPQVYLRLTDNWVELTVRFIVEDHGVRSVKDAMSRDILAALEEAGIGLASATVEIVGLPPLQWRNGSGASART